MFGPFRKKDKESGDLTSEAVLEALRRIHDPHQNDDIVSLGMVSDIFISEGMVYFSIAVDADKAREMEPIRAAAEKVVASMPGVAGTMVSLTAERKPGAAPAPAAPQQAPARGPAKAGVPGVKHIIAVASGKGGVGKSTTTANLALGLKATGLKVGILDADVYGPSQPRIMGVKGRPQTNAENALMPMDGHGLQVMSIGFLVEEETPMIWRGPMVMQALTQMLREVAWDDLDVLVVDMPPGTGDAQLTLAQQVPLAGAVIVSTPQDLALIDARKGINMFRKVDVPILGIIENMSYFLCPSCGERSDIFGTGGARQEAERLGVRFLGEVPLHMAIRETSDGGNPVVASEPDGLHAAIFREIAESTWTEIEAHVGAPERSAPKIVVE